ncbi:hypothetical protein Tel_01905 [Candidatus Tenderia electrophaga]|jgi:hypothetical protein|uniref:Uncharacterized protein n=1 Tax=Candidatus Tenderia electrophaga TaxID=1748243 RepID=A0A0S2TA08_9GAMM|nr:hypothetical protein Tel_01905 [Candidatus Tenderia electrophaga]
MDSKCSFTVARLCFCAHVRLAIIGLIEFFIDALKSPDDNDITARGDACNQTAVAQIRGVVQPV